MGEAHEILQTNLDYSRLFLKSSRMFWTILCELRLSALSLAGGGGGAAALARGTRLAGAPEHLAGVCAAPPSQPA